MPSLRSKRRLTVVESECGVALDVAVAHVPLPPPVKFEAGVRLDGSVALWRRPILLAGSGMNFLGLPVM